MPGIPAIAPYPLPGSQEAPAPVVGWTVDPARAVLLVHDMQRFFLRPFPEEVRGPLVDNVAALRARAARLGVPVAYTQQPGGMSPDERGLLADLWGPGMSADPADRAVVDELTPHPGDWTFTKWRYSAFCRSDLRQRMVAAGRDQLVVAGVYAHVGVLMTAVDAFQFDVQPFLVADAIADFTPAAHQQALDYAARCCAVVTTTAEVFS